MSQAPLGILFNYDWDQLGYARAAPGLDVPLVEAGFDLFSFPSNLRLAFFDLETWVERLAGRARKQGWQGVASNHEQFGALAAALLAEKMHWPGTPVEAILACQHKLYARQLLQEVAPEANVGFQEVDAGYGEPLPEGLEFPAFAKPVKAAFSVLARQVANEQELRALTRFSRTERWIIQRLVEPFEQLAQQRLWPLQGQTLPSAHRMLLEEPAQAQQFNLDGYVYQGQVQALGVVDAIMYPGTQAFMSHQLPTQLPQAVQQQALQVARSFLQAAGFDHGLFNMEFFYDAQQQRLTVIEFNPRMASQYSDLYLQVKGIDLHRVSLRLAQGQDPGLAANKQPTAGAAASFVYRAFDWDQVVAQPSRAQEAAFKQAFPEGWLLRQPKGRAGIARDLKWLESYRYGLVHLYADNLPQLYQKQAEASRLLGWPVLSPD